MVRTINGQTESTRGQLGQGIYSLAELRTYVGFYGEARDGEWALYWLSDVLNPVAHEPRRPDYSFSDLISLFVVRELLDLGVKPRRIREAEQYMRKRFRTDRPFVIEEVETDGVDVWIRSDEPEQVEAASRAAGQQAHRRIVAEYLKRVVYREGRAALWSPVRGVVLDPRLQFGQPVIEGTRVPTASVAEIAEVVGVPKAAEHLDLPVGVADAAVSFERRLDTLRS